MHKILGFGALCIAAVAITFENPGVNGVGECTVCPGFSPGGPAPVRAGSVPGADPTDALLGPGCPPAKAPIPNQAAPFIVPDVNAKIDKAVNALASDSSNGIDLTFEKDNCDPRLVGSVDGHPVDIKLKVTSGSFLKGKLNGFLAEDSVGQGFTIGLGLGQLFDQESVTDTLLHELEHLKERIGHTQSGVSCDFDRSNDPACSVDEEIAVVSKTLAGLCSALCDGVDLDATAKEDLEAAIEQHKAFLEGKLAIKASQGAVGVHCPYCTTPWTPGADGLCDCGV